MDQDQHTDKQDAQQAMPNFEMDRRTAIFAQEYLLDLRVCMWANHLGLTSGVLQSVVPRSSQTSWTPTRNSSTTTCWYATCMSAIVFRDDVTSCFCFCKGMLPNAMHGQS